MKELILFILIILIITLFCVSIFSYVYLQNYEKAIYELLLGGALSGGLGELVK